MKTTKKGRHTTSGFAKVRQSELVFEYFSEIVDCRTCRKAADPLCATAKPTSRQDNKAFLRNGQLKYTQV